MARQLLVGLVRQNVRGHRAVVLVGVLLLGIATASNFVTVHHVNRLAPLVHTVPYSWKQVCEQIVLVRREITTARYRRAIVVEFVPGYARVASDFEKHAYALFGPRYRQTHFGVWFAATYRDAPLLNENTLRSFLKAYLPGTALRFEWRIAQPGQPP